MSYTRDRDEFIARMSRDGLPLDVITKLLRYASTPQRLAVAQCNGDWPADNGERKTKECPQCGSGWAPSGFRNITLRTVNPDSYGGGGAPAASTTVRSVCPDCWAEWRVRAIVEESNAANLGAPAWAPVFQGDPRGAVLRLVPAGTSREDIDSGRERGIYVPARGR